MDTLTGTRPVALKHLDAAIDRFKDVKENGSAATSAYDLMMGYWPCWSIRILANHVLYYRRKLAEYPAELFDNPEPDTSYISEDYNQEFTVKGCTCPKHKEAT